MEHEMRLAVIPGDGDAHPMVMPYCVGCGWVGERRYTYTAEPVADDWRTHVKLEEGGRLERVVLCEHGFDESHRVFTDARGMERCAKGSRTVVWPPKEGEQEAVSHG